MVDALTGPPTSTRGPPRCAAADRGSTSSPASRPAGSCWPPRWRWTPAPGWCRSARPASCPRERIAAEYALEYGTATLELHTDSIRPGQRVLLVDDVLATGGTLRAAIALVEQLGGVVTAVSVVIELAALGGRQRIAPHPVHALWTT